MQKNTMEMICALLHLSLHTPPTAHPGLHHHLHQLHLWIPAQETNMNACISSGSELVRQQEFKAPGNAIVLKMKSPYSLWWWVNFTWSVMYLG